ncbi:MAG: endolytic transglycosylase MltG [Clostridia bacterium]|nr:endolytic transglycosylase MltG [Clostridia bacterium]
MDENRPTGQQRPEETFTFDQLTTEEKRRLIGALSMGRLSDEEKRQLADAVRRSHLSDAERAQISRAFALSRMSDEERREFLLRRQQEKQAAQQTASAPAATPPVQQPAADDRTRAHTVVRRSDTPQSPAAPQPEQETSADAMARTTVQNTAPVQMQKAAAPVSAPQTDAVTRPVSTAALQQTGAEREGEYGMVRSLSQHERPRPKKPHRQEEEDDYRDSDTTAITSLLKGIVYIVAVLVISVFASWTIIEVANDVFAFVKSDETVTVVIEENMTAADVAGLLADNGIIKYPTMYELYIRIKEESTDYLVGEYEISPSMNYGDINDTFTYVANTKEQVVITIPEGYTVDQIINLMLKNGIGTREGFVAAINEYEYTGYRFLEGLNDLDPERKYRLEGYLFPDTYYFFKDSSEVAVIDKFLVNFERKVSEEYYERAEQLGMTMDDIIILASMIQAEGMTLTDFENISSVFHNRLANPRSYPLLQSDATLQYILDKRKSALSAEDLKIDSGYNSYLYAGLPPGSICNPGMDAINCALYPAETGYYYFLADGKGNTYFSETNEQHEELKKLYIDNQ